MHDKLITPPLKSQICETNFSQSKLIWSLATAGFVCFSPIVGAQNYNFIGTASKYIQIVADSNGEWILKNKIEDTQTHTFEEDGKIVGEIDINFNPADKVSNGNYLMLQAIPNQLPEEGLDLVRLNFKTDAKFASQNEYSSWPTVAVRYGYELDLTVDSGKTLTIDYLPEYNQTNGVVASDEGTLYFNGGNLQINAIGSYKFDSDQAVLAVDSNAITVGAPWDSGGLLINNQSVRIESQLQTPSDWIRATKFNGGMVFIETDQFQITNAEGAQRFAIGLNTMDGNSTEIVAGKLLIDADVAVSSQDEQTQLRISGRDLMLLGRVEAYDGAQVTFAGQQNASSSVKIITAKADTVVGMPADAPTRLNHSPIIRFETNALISAEGLSTEGESDYRKYHPGEFGYAAIRANRLSEIYLSTPGAVYNIYGNLVAGRGQETDQAGGKIYFAGGAGSSIIGDVLAGNTGSIDLSLNDGAVFEGRADDYADANLQNQIFRPGEFLIDVVESGTISLTMNNATWTARGNSYVTSVAFDGNDSSTNIVDMTKEERSALTIGSVSGAGTVRMRLDAKNESHAGGDMLYVRDASNGELTVEVEWVDGVGIEQDQWIRFATIGDSGIQGFSAVTRDQGFFNVKYATKQVSREEDDAHLNEAYDGSQDAIENGDAFKPGEDVVNEMFADGASNWYIGFTDDSESNVSDAGQTILGTARAAYWNAVIIDRFNQRYGDRVYDQNNHGIWARIKHEHIGTNAGIGDFNSNNTTYQFGYDYTKSTDNGKMIWGGALDYMHGNTDYDSINGDGGTDRLGGLLYATYLSSNGAYADLVLRAGRLSADYEMYTPSGTKIDADYDHWMYGLSFEAGHQLENGTGWFLEPQLQAQYARIMDGDYCNQQTKVEQDAIDSIITRAGFRVGKYLSDNKVTLGYIKADVMREWMGEQDIRVYDVTTASKGADVSISNHGTWFDVGGGFQVAIAHDLYAYGDVEYRFGNDFDKCWILNIGAKYRF